MVFLPFSKFPIMNKHFFKQEKGILNFKLNAFDGNPLLSLQLLPSTTVLILGWPKSSLGNELFGQPTVVL